MDDFKVILAKKETTYATDAVPTVAANAALTRNFTSTPLEVDQLDRNLDVPTRGRSKSAPTNKRKRYSFELEMAGSGAAGSAAPWMEFLEACGMRPPELVEDTSATQRFVGATDAISALTFYDWLQSDKRVGLGARGTFGWNWTAGAYPFLKFDFTALVPVSNLGMSTAAPGTPIFTRWKDPVEINTDNSVFLLDGYAVKMQSFTGEVNAEINIRNLVGANYVQRGDHGITGTIVCEAVEIGTKNFFSKLAVGDQIVVDTANGKAAGNTVAIYSTKTQILSIAESVDQGKIIHTLGYGMNVGSGSDDISIAAK